MPLLPDNVHELDPAALTTMLIGIAHRQLAAVHAMSDQPADMWSEIGSQLTCIEVDLLVELFISLGIDEHADALLEAHARGEEPSDAHYELRLMLEAAQ